MAASPPPRESSFAGVQLSLFQRFLYNTADERDKLSNTIEFWDAVPKYFVSRKEMHNLRTTDGFLLKIKRTFQYGGRSFTVRIRPARLTDAQGREQEFYPSAREELVEDALRKIAAEQNHGFYEDAPENSRSGVVFSLHLLRKELAKRGHTLSYQQVTEALDVLSDASIEIFTSEGKSFLRSSILPNIVGVKLTDLKNDPKARWYADFCPLVTESIRAMTYRQFDYHNMMQHTSQLARWLHKRLAHNYTNASYMTPYECLFSSVKRDSGLLE
ncbi:MAG: replication protein [Gammaproteobacteria bacterium]|nr:replication protein [Gammaproteobacteria bacterium]